MPIEYSFSEVHGNNATPIHEKVAADQSAPPTPYEKEQASSLQPLSSAMKGEKPPTGAPSAAQVAASANDHENNKLAPYHPTK